MYFLTILILNLCWDVTEYIHQQDDNLLLSLVIFDSLMIFSPRLSVVLLWIILHLAKIGRRMYRTLTNIEKQN
jgi:hypothetical protein